MAEPPVATVRSQIDISYLGKRDAGFLDALDRIFRRALFFQRCPQNSRGFERGAFARGVGRKHDRISAFESVNGHRDHGDHRVGDRQKACNHTRWLGVFDNTFLRDLFNDADAFLSKRVPKNAYNFETPRGASFGASHIAFIDAHLREGDERFLVGCGPCDSTAQIVNRRPDRSSPCARIAARALSSSPRASAFSSSVTALAILSPFISSPSGRFLRR